MTSWLHEVSALVPAFLHACRTASAWVARSGCEACVVAAAVLLCVRDKLNLDVIFDTRDLEAAGISPDTPVTLKITRPAPGEQVLNWILRSVASGDARYAIDHGVVLISSRARLSGMTVTRVYDLSGIAEGPEAGRIEDLIVRFVAPGDWVQTGGEHGSVAAFGDKLVVTQTEPNQREVEKLLTLLKGRGSNRGTMNGGPDVPRPPSPITPRASFQATPPADSNDPYHAVPAPRS